MEHVKLSEFTPDPKNANKGTERGRGMLEKSLQELGAGRSVLADKHGVLIAGNKTLQTAVEAGFEDAIVVESDGTRLVIVKRTDLDLSTDEKAKQLAIADNRVGQISLEWDADVLAELSQEVDLSGFFTNDELANLMPTAEPPTAEEDEETTADLMEQADAGAIESRVKLGDVIQLGRHYIACADSTSEANIRKLIAIASCKTPSFVWNDPPFGIDLHTSYKGGSNTGRVNYAPVIGDKDLTTVTNAFRACSFPLAVSVWWGANHYCHLVSASPCWIVWDKKEEGDFEVTFADCELAWTNAVGQARVFKHLWRGFRRDSEVGQKRVHPTQKPIALAEWCFDKYGKPDDVILDQFLGSGMSIIAAQQMEGTRSVVGFELSPEYCEVICRRFESLTGKTAELVGNL